MNEFEIREKVLSEAIQQGNIALEKLESISLSGDIFCDQMLLNMMEKNKDTEYGRRCNFKDVHSYSDYKRIVPISTYENYRELVEQITENGTQGLLTKDDVVHFCPTSGTTSGPKHIPVVADSIKLSTAYTLPTAFALVDRKLKELGKGGLSFLKGLFNVEIGSFGCTKSGINIGGISGTSVKASNDVLEYITCTPREVITPDGYIDSKYIQLLFALEEKDLGWLSSCYMTPLAGMLDTLVDKWEDLCEDIENGTIHDNIDMSEKARNSLTAKLRKDPERAKELREIFKNGFNDGVMKKVWPKLQAVLAIGTGGFKVHTDRVKIFVGDDVLFCHLVISSSESLIAVVEECNSEEFVMIPMAAYFEFIPVDSDISNIKNINELEVGKKYELVVSTISGLYRYRIYDVIEVTGFHNKLPKVKFSHRANVFLDVAGEKTTEADMLRAIKYFEKETGVQVAEFCAYANTTVEPGRYELLIEPVNKMDTGKIVEYEEVLDKGFCETFTYRYEREAGNLLPLHLSIQQRQTHLLYRELQIMKGTNPNQIKPVRILNTEEKKMFFTKMVKLREKIR